MIRPSHLQGRDQDHDEEAQWINALAFHVASNLAWRAEAGDGGSLPPLGQVVMVPLPKPDW